MWGLFNVNIFKYKGYTGTIEASVEDKCFHGEILFINDLITYEGETFGEMQSSFEEAVDDYLAYCEETGNPANKPFSGTLNVRIGQELHKKAAEKAHARGLSLNELIAQSIRTNVEEEVIPPVQRTHLHKHVFSVGSQTAETAIAISGQPFEWEVKRSNEKDC